MSQSVLDTYRALHPKSAILAERARQVIPGGVTHDSRHLKPFAVYVDRAQGSRKWDVDGLEYVDYWMGHGALFLGHCHPAVVKAIQAQAARGTHLGASHEAEVRWAELVHLLRCALLNNGLDCAAQHGWVSAVHTAEDLDRTLTGYDKALRAMAADTAFKGL